MWMRTTATRPPPAITHNKRFRKQRLTWASSRQEPVAGRGHSNGMASASLKKPPIQERTSIKVVRLVRIIRCRQSIDRSERRACGRPTTTTSYSVVVSPSQRPFFYSSIVQPFIIPSSFARDEPCLSRSATITPSVAGGAARRHSVIADSILCRRRPPASTIRCAGGLVLANRVSRTTVPSPPQQTHHKHHHHNGIVIIF